MPNDVVVAGDSAYVTDTGKPLIWRLPARRDGIGEPEVDGMLADPAWDCPTTIAKADGQLLVVCSQIVAKHLGNSPRLPFEVIGTDFPAWD